MEKSDLLYEKAIAAQIAIAVDTLEELRSKPSWMRLDRLAAERILQVLIEAFIGFARYTLETRFAIHVSKSREALDHLKNLNVIGAAEHSTAMNAFCLWALSPC